MKLHQTQLSGMILMGLVFIFFLISTSVLHAQNGKITFTKKSEIEKSKIQTVQPIRKPEVQPIQKPVVQPVLQSASSVTAKNFKTVPDLTITSAKWSNVIKAGDTVGMSSILNITVKNQGSAVARGCEMKITCHSLSGATCPVGMTGTKNVLQLDPGKSQNYPWPSASPVEKWVSGKYRLTILVDSLGQVAESSETNNKQQMTFTVHSNANLQQTNPNNMAELTSPAVNTAPASSLAGLSIISPKPNDLLLAPRSYMITYMAVGVEKIDLDYLIYDLNSQGHSKNTFKTKRLVRDQIPTGSCSIQIQTDMAPRINTGGSTPLSGHTQYSDGKVAIRLSAQVNGKKIERLCPLRVKIPKIRLVQPASDSKLYTGQWYEARWSTIGHRLETVKLHIAKEAPGGLPGVLAQWTVEVPNTGRCRFQVPFDLNIDIPTGGRNVYFIVQEDFNSSLWSQSVISVESVRLY